MNNPSLAWSQRSAFGAIDWGKTQHQLVVIDPTGRILLRLKFDHTADGWALFREKMAAFPGLAVVLELKSGLMVEQLIALGLTVYALNPACTAAYRQRNIPGGSKDDLRDAWSLAEALRHDGHRWEPVSLPDAATQELDLYVRDEVALIAERTALVNQLQATVHDYFPVLLNVFKNWTVPSTWDFLALYSTPEILLKAGPRRWTTFFNQHKMWRADLGPKRIKLLAQADQLCASAPIIAAKSFYALHLVNRLRLLEKQLQEYRHRIQVLFDQHPARAIFDSLPGAGPKLAPRLLTGIMDNMDPTGPQSLQCRAGTAPVRFQSGQINKTQIRRACDHHLRSTVHLFCDLSRNSCAWAEAYYQAQKKRGKSHACALRCLGQRWLNIIYALVKTNTPYIESIHTQNQIKHGSWVVQAL